MVRRLRRLPGDIAWGVSWAFALAVLAWVLSAIIVGVTNARRGDGVLGPVGWIAAFYALGAAFAGVIVGLMRPLLRTPLGAGVCGMLASVPLSVVAEVMEVGSLDPSTRLLVGIVSVAVLLGLPLGITYHRIFR